MENASKALIIAGAILLSILLISLGLMVYNQAKDTIGSVNLSQQEIEAFNSKFTSYEGTNISGSQVNALIQAVIASNQAEKSASTNKFISIKLTGEAKTVNEQTGDIITKTASDFTLVSGKSQKVVAGMKYSVTLGYDSSVVNSVTINR